jgi:hypothetical protein
MTTALASSLWASQLKTGGEKNTVSATVDLQVCRTPIPQGTLCSLALPRRALVELRLLGGLAPITKWRP